MEAASTSETSVNFYQTARRNNPDDSHLQVWILPSLKIFENPIFIVLILYEQCHRKKMTLNCDATELCGHMSSHVNDPCSFHVSTRSSCLFSSVPSWLIFFAFPPSRFSRILFFGIFLQFYPFIPLACVSVSLFLLSFLQCLSAFSSLSFQLMDDLAKHVTELQRNVPIHWCETQPSCVNYVP
jgi:hypothetical protein